jgi:hypothetical protein
MVVLVAKLDLAAPPAGGALFRPSGPRSRRSRRAYPQKRSAMHRDECESYISFRAGAQPEPLRKRSEPRPQEAVKYPTFGRFSSAKDVENIGSPK